MKAEEPGGTNFQAAVVCLCDKVYGGENEPRFIEEIGCFFNQPVVRAMNLVSVKLRCANSKLKLNSLCF